ETTMDTIEWQMPDENIDREALHEALGSLYRDSMLISPGRVTAILATTSMLQLDELIQQYGEVMKETVSAQTVCSYYYSDESAIGDGGGDGHVHHVEKVDVLAATADMMGPARALFPDTDSWFARSRRESEGTPFLETEQGRVFGPVFQQLRLAYVILDLTSAHVIQRMR
ncbi:hypothetical protein EI555_015379, partial [Monodon monoceros]